jgi:hypothetical protein
MAKKLAEGYLVFFTETFGVLDGGAEALLAFEVLFFG